MHNISNISHSIQDLYPPIGQHSQAEPSPSTEASAAPHASPSQQHEEELSPRPAPSPEQARESSHARMNWLAANHACFKTEDDDFKDGDNAKNNVSGHAAPVAGKPQNIKISHEIVHKKLNPSELNFYQHHLHHFQGIAPDIAQINAQDSSIDMINISRGMIAPKIVDIKVGEKFTNDYYIRHVKGLSDENKIRNKIQERRQSSAENGYRENNYLIAGYSGQDKSKSKYERARDIVRKTPQNVFHDFLNGNKVTAEKIALQLSHIQAKLRTSPCSDYALISSSVLIAFDEKNPEHVNAKIIDFNNALQAKPEDPTDKKAAVLEFNQLFHRGLDNLIKHFGAI